MNNVIYSSKHFCLLKWRHRKSDKVHYRLEMMDSWWAIGPSTNGELVSMADQVRDIVDPTRCRSGHTGKHWKYRSLNEAEKMYTLLVMKFS